MLKLLLIVTIVAILTTGTLATQPDKTSSQKQQSTKQGQPSPVASALEKHDSSDQDKGKASYHSSNWYAAFENPDGMLVIVGLITCLVIGWQSIETRRSAKGALLNAQYLVNIERPWLFLETSYELIHLVKDTQWYDIGVTNHGRTIAEIVGCADPILYLVENSGKLPVSFPTSTTIREIVPPVRVLPDKKIDVTQIQEDDVLNFCGSHEQQSRLFKGEISIYAVGIIKFRDLLTPPTNKPHELHWCCRVKHDGNQLTIYLDGPKECNYQT